MGRATRVAEAQAQAALKVKMVENGGAQALRDAGANPVENRNARKQAADATLNPEKRKAQRGAGKAIQKGQ